MARREAGLLWTAVVALAAAACTPSLHASLEDGAPPPSRPCRGAPRVAAPPEPRPRYRMSLHVRPRRGLASGVERVSLAPGRRVRRLVFRLWPNGPFHERARLDVSSVAVNGRRAERRVVDPTTLAVELPPERARGEEVTATLRWELRLPGAVLDRLSHSGDAVVLGSFFPLLAWEDGRGWATDPPTTALGETSTSPTADFVVRISVPRASEVLATGREVGPGVWRAEAVRDFAVAVGRFRVATGIVRAPEPVRVAVGVERDAGGSPRRFFAEVRGALADLSERFGAYPWDTFTVAVMPALGPAGIEYPTMVFQGPRSLERATTHEVGHMWFYSLVGNNQAHDPWLDEGLASWAQARGQGLLDWFARVPLSRAARGRLGRPMSFWERHDSSYFGGVYAQGVQALSALGRPDRIDCALRLYAARNAYRTAHPADLVAALEDVFPAAGRVMARFGVAPGRPRGASRP